MSKGIIENWRKRFKAWREEQIKASEARMEKRLKEREEKEVSAREVKKKAENKSVDEETRIKNYNQDYNEAFRTLNTSTDKEKRASAISTLKRLEADKLNRGKSNKEKFKAKNLETKRAELIAEKKHREEELLIEEKRREDEQLLQEKLRLQIENEFLISSEYSFIQKAANDLKNGKEVSYENLKSNIGSSWQFSSDNLYKFISNELYKQGLNYEVLVEQIRKRKEFENSPSYKYVRQFVKKYGEKGKIEDLFKLQTLLNSWQWDFQTEELKHIISKENKQQHLENLKSKILKHNLHNRGAVLKSYLNFYRSNDDENLKRLAEILEERYSSTENIVQLKIELVEIEKRIELENFERRLAEADEIIDLENIDQLNGYEFEDFLKNLFLKMGYQVEQTRLSGDQGADLVVIKFGEKTVVQAKRYGAKVGNFAVQEIMAAISLYKAQKGMVITNNYFTPAAIELAQANKIELVNRDTLEELINDHW